MYHSNQDSHYLPTVSCDILVQTVTGNHLVTSREFTVGPAVWANISLPLQTKRLLLCLFDVCFLMYISWSIWHNKMETCEQMQKVEHKNTTIYTYDFIVSPLGNVISLNQLLNYLKNQSCHSILEILYKKLKISICYKSFFMNLRC